jgi:hypothetical protein
MLSHLTLIQRVLVVEEADALKRDRQPRVMRRARGVINRLWNLPRGADGLITVRAGVAAEIMLDEPWHVRLPVNDAEIAGRAEYIRELTGREVTLTAADTGILFRPRELKLNAVRMPSRSADQEIDSDAP